MSAVVSWGDATVPELARALEGNPIVVLPVGAMEAHGPHLCSDADAVIANAVAARTASSLVAEHGESVVLLPALPYGVCHAARPFSGTINISDDVLIGLIVDVGREIARHGGRRLCLTVHHWDPPHLAAIDRAVHVLSETGDIRCAVFDRRSLDDSEVNELFPEGPGSGLRHGGRVETSIVLAVAPTKVRTDVMLALPPVWVDLMEQFKSGATTFEEAGGRDAYFGDPAAATPDEGERILDYMAERVVRVALQELR